MGKVILIGAGCGKGLITVKGVEKLKNADVIIYDDLIDRDLLNAAKSDCELIYVGKRIGKHSESQQKINEILIEKAKSKSEVVRLKGGDSFVFGRGGEEIIALQNENIAYEVVPGVTSAVAVPEDFGIPVTHRGTSQSFTVITGHTATEQEENYSALAKLNGTLVFLMGLHNASYISQKLIENGKDKNTACAILSKGFSKNGKRIDCTLQTLGEFAKKAQTPAIIVVGETARLDFSKTILHELAGVSVTVTGTKQFTQKLANGLEKVGAEVITYPYLEIIPLKDVVYSDFNIFKWMVFTSANGVDLFFEHLKCNSIDYRSLMHLKFACIGKGSAQKLKEYGFIADFVPSEYTAKALGEQLGKIIDKKDKLLILRSDNGSNELTDELKKAGADFEDVHTYTAIGKGAERISCESDYIVFASGSSVDTFFKNGGILNKTVPVCIGEVTAKKFMSYTDVDFLVAKEHTADGIIETIKEILK